MFKTKKELKSFISWSIFNGLFFICIYFWLIHKNIYAINIGKFLIWVHLMLSGMVLIDKTKTLKNKYSNYTKTHLIFYSLFDTFLALFIAAFGHFIFASIYLLGSIFQWTSYPIFIQENIEEGLDND